MIGVALALALAGPIAYEVPQAGTYVRGERLVAGRQLAWSRDGSRTAYVRGGDLFLAGRDAARPVRVARGGVSSPSWSPDGKRIVFERDGALVVLRADRVAERVLVRKASSDPAWSPDGRYIAFTCVGRDICVIRPDGLRRRTLTDEAGVEAFPSWSPRGDRIVYSSDVSGRSQIHALRADGRGKIRLTNSPTHDERPAWSPDGRRVAFVRDGAAWAMNADGSGQRRVAARAADVAWQPLPPVRELLPDLAQRAPHSLVVTRRRGRWAIAFSSAVDNVGEGPLWITGARRAGTPFMDGVQRTSLASGGSRAYRDVGFWRYVFADSHVHWHFLPFERYELLDGDGRALVRDHKSGFCLGDRFPHARRVNRAPPRFPVGACQSGNRAATTVSGGTSVGWTDRYFPNYHGQNLTLSGVPAGVYTLVHRVNPDLLFQESRYDNNAASVRIRLAWRAGVPRVTTLRVCESAPRC